MLQLSHFVSLHPTLPSEQRFRSRMLVTVSVSSCPPGAVVAILRVVEKLSPKGDEEIEDENVESLQALFDTCTY